MIMVCLILWLKHRCRFFRYQHDIMHSLLSTKLEGKIAPMPGYGLWLYRETKVCMAREFYLLKKTAMRHKREEVRWFVWYREFYLKNPDPPGAAHAT